MKLKDKVAIITGGSRGMAGKLQEKVIPFMEDDTGRKLETAIRQMDGYPKQIDEARRSSGDIFAFFELSHRPATISRFAGDSDRRC